jgi:hypothetical protein
MRALITFLSAVTMLLFMAAPANATPTPIDLTAEPGQLTITLPATIDIVVEAQVRNANTGQELGGVLVKFKVTGDGSVMCTDHSDNGGKAGCTARVTELQLVLLLVGGYDAVVDGTLTYGSAQSHTTAQIV